jgi:hypothetical protein
MDWLLYFLIFLFGYITCKTFYFLKSTRLSMAMVKASHVIYLSAMIKALENMAYSREIMLEHMLKTEKKGVQISSFEFRFEEDVRTLKERSIEMLKELHPTFFRQMLDFDNWDEGAAFLLKHKEVAWKFWERE